MKCGPETVEAKLPELTPERTARLKAKAGMTLAILQCAEEHGITMEALPEAICGALDEIFERKSK